MKVQSINGHEHDRCNVIDSNTTQAILPPTTPHALSVHQRLAYSVGHVLNDLCSAMWFSYLLVYMHFVQQFDSTTAGILLLVGQLADGIATPFVGIESDKIHNWSFCRYGRRKSWHLLGTICVIFSFPFLFNSCITCHKSHEYAQVIYYSAFIIIFQFGWASTQISHLSLIPDLTPYSCERVELNAYRYSFTVASNIAVYAITWLVLGIGATEVQEGESSTICPDDAPHFRIIVFSIVIIGTVFSLIFHIVVKEDQEAIRLGAFGNSLINNDSVDYSLPSNHLKWNHWFKVSQFYKVGLLYMGTRLTINLTQVYTPLYLQDNLHLPRQSIAYIPLVMYVSGFISSFIMKYLNTKAGKKLTYFIGCLIALVSYTWLYLGKGDSYRYFEIYFVVALIGVSGSTMLITSLGITNDMIGHNISSGAFVFGAMSFLDKISNGIAVMIIQSIHSSSKSKCTDCDNYYRNVLTFVCGGSTILALVALALLIPHQIGAKRSRKHLVEPETDDHIDTNSVGFGEDNDCDEPLLDNHTTNEVDVQRIVV